MFPGFLPQAFRAAHARFSTRHAERAADSLRRNALLPNRGLRRKQDSRRNGERPHPSAHRHLWDDPIDQVRGAFGHAPRAGGTGVYSPSGIYGDATLATAAKGERLIEAMLADILADIPALRDAAR